MKGFIELTNTYGKKHLFKKDLIFEVEDLGKYSGCRVYSEGGSIEVCESYKYVADELLKSDEYLE